MLISGWGRNIWVDASISSPPNSLGPINLEKLSSAIPRGLGRSYGDSSLAQNVICLENNNLLIHFDDETGILECESGVSLFELNNIFISKGWFLPVTPGTQFITVGGAIASDVHGKNHHIDGTFSNFIIEFDLLLGNGEVITVGPSSYPELFKATCGGMGLTGVILKAKIQLIPIQSNFILERKIATTNLSQTMHAFELYANAKYVVAWVDCFAKGSHLGRSILMVGEHSEAGGLDENQFTQYEFPHWAPKGLLNGSVLRAFNSCYYLKQKLSKCEILVPLRKFFYPLDAIKGWNVMYGKEGFLQYQFVLPEEVGMEGLRDILREISESGRGSFLAVLKKFGPKNSNYLSFPLQGYTLALDFKIDPGLYQFLERLDILVGAYGGRVYLTKDSRMSEKMFKDSYPEWPVFQSVREKYHAINKFSSLQSVRLGL
ncbi:FAD-binding oxidoreductase [Polynucleobacter sp. es-EL-1]|uniref:FAD-binding oxidoreductase n=1 Tax=Polynucleobacter sp. es-EL-1 TaxID=1855652 RepID=UPI00203DFF6C|nr:FAD-binding oxidoreductase [Polynucleobacter sp. es-EL-1]QWE10864.1 FAD-binding oxidoreductase [Polynucleobacter sp. es-EL-1]